MKRFLLVGAVAALATAGPAAASTFHGVVVARAHGGVLVAGPNGAVRAVHTHARVGSRVVVSGSRMAIVGSARHAEIRGVVVRRGHGLTVLSAARTLMAVHGTTPAPTVQPGDMVQTDVTIGAQGTLDEDAIDDLGAAGSPVQVQAVVSAVGAGTVTVTVNGQPLTLSLPAGLTLPASVVGQTVTFTLSFGGGQVTAGEDDQGGDDQGDNNNAATTTVTFAGGGGDHGDGGHGD